MTHDVAQHQSGPTAAAETARSWAADPLAGPRPRVRIPDPRRSAEQQPAAAPAVASRPLLTYWACVAVAAAVAAATPLLHPAGAQAAVVVAGLLAAAALVTASRPRRRSAALRRPLRLIGTGIGLLTVAEVLRPVGGAFPTGADTVAFVGYPFLLAGLLWLSRARLRESAVDTVLIAAIVPVSLGGAVWLPFLGTDGTWAPGADGTAAVAAFLAVDLLAVTILLRLTVLARGGPHANVLLLAGFGCLLGAHVARVAGAVTGSVPAPFGSQTLLVLGFGLAAAGVLHPSLTRTLEAAPAARGPLSRLHLALLMGAVAAGPLVVLLHPGQRQEWMLLAVGGPAVASLLVVAHLSRLLRERVRLEHESTHDPLTALPHRAHFHELLDRALARGNAADHGVAVMFIDLDDFKNVNDRLGHAAGDALLRQVAERLRSSTRRGDVVARLGGDEFGVLLHCGTTRAEAVDIAQRILVTVGAPVELPGGSADVTPSIGVALAPEHGNDADALVRNADSAMYHAKKAGRNRVQFYDEGIGEQVRARLGVQSRLRTALDQQEMVLHYQPKVDLRTGSVAGVEALVRWQHPSLGLIGPGAFISQAERSGLIAPLGEWVMRTACLQAAEWRHDGVGDVPVSVNISPRQFAFQDVTAMVQDALAESGLPPHLLEVELTESVSMGGEDAASTMRELDRLGVQCSIDDFGTGYSSISYLHDYRVDTIKIDRSFVAGISRNDRDGPIVRAVIAMAHNLGMRVVAEGVETAEQTEFLREHGCDLAQGYLFGRPGSVGSLRSLVAGVATTPPLSDRPSGWDERELGQRLWLEQQDLSVGLAAGVVDVTDLADVRTGYPRGLVLLTAASGVLVPLVLGVGAGNGLPATVQVALNQALMEAGIPTARAPRPDERSRSVFSGIALELRERGTSHQADPAQAQGPEPAAAAAAADPGDDTALAGGADTTDSPTAAAPAAAPAAEPAPPRTADDVVDTAPAARPAVEQDEDLPIARPVPGSAAPRPDRPSAPRPHAADADATPGGPDNAPGKPTATGRPAAPAQDAPAKATPHPDKATPRPDNGTGTPATATPAKPTPPTTSSKPTKSAPPAAAPKPADPGGSRPTSKPDSQPVSPPREVASPGAKSPAEPVRASHPATAALPTPPAAGGAAAPAHSPERPEKPAQAQSHPTTKPAPAAGGPATDAPRADAGGAAPAKGKQGPDVERAPGKG